MSISFSFSNILFIALVPLSHQYIYILCEIFLFYLFVHWPVSPSSSAPSLRLAYKDLEQQRKIEEQKLKGLDGKKKEQAERLGMGLGARRCVDVLKTSGGRTERFPPLHSLSVLTSAVECLTL